MHRLKGILIYIPLLVLMIGLYFNQSYQNQQDLIVLESNILKTSNHLILSQDEANLVLRKMDTYNGNFWLIEKIKNGDTDILNIFTNNWANLHFPLKGGQLLNENNISKALVGHSIQTVVEENKEYVVCFGRKYEVVGRLGRLEKSPLSKTILISDKKFFAYKGEFSLNGVLGDGNLSRLGKKGSNAGAERLFSLSQFNLLLNVTTLTFVILSTIFWSYIVIRKNWNSYQIYHLLGKSWLSIYREALFILLLANLCMLTIFLGLFIIRQEKAVMLSHYLAMLSVELISFSYLFYKGITNEK